MIKIKGGICAVRGVSASGVKKGKNGLALIKVDGVIAGVFTRNRIKAAPVVLTRKVVKRGKVKCIIVNSGCANSSTGRKGYENALRMAELAGGELGVSKNEVAVASTGIIGRHLNMELIESQLKKIAKKLEASAAASRAVAEAILTTDTFPKEVAYKMDGCHLGGIAKGAGMIAPKLATLLSFIFTDADFSSCELQRMLNEAVNRSFNMVVVDNDTSTNDMVLLVSTGGRKIPRRRFQKALTFLCVELAKMVARDGEGATKLIECRVKNAATQREAEKVVRSILASPLVKSAFFGSSTNWGRIISAAGASGAKLSQEMSLTLRSGKDGWKVLDRGKVRHGEREIKRIMRRMEIIIDLNLRTGKFKATGWGCDLTPEYIKINAT
jgi:glutamate N-acetyltransferase/amino-acid N-acetyltransferase